MSQPILEINNLSKVFPSGELAVNNVSFSVEEGEFVGIIGLSGSGKSTLLRCINRLIEPSEGSVKFEGVEMTTLNRRELREKRSQMAMVFQHFNLINRMSVISNVLSGRLGKTGSVKSILQSYDQAELDEAQNYLNLVGLADKSKNRADELSGGQKQRVAIARALLQNPKILLADEPVASLDPATSHSVMEYLEKANKEYGKTILCSLHFLSLVRQYTTRVIALKKGQIVYQGDSKEIDEAWFKEIYGEDAREVEIR